MFLLTLGVFSLSFIRLLENPFKSLKNSITPDIPEEQRIQIKANAGKLY
jgi:hypothetical protein